MDDPAELGAPGALGQGPVAGREGGSAADPAPLVPVALPFGGPAIRRLRILPCGRSGCLSGVSVTHTHQSQRVVGRLPSDERSSDDTWSMTRHSTDSG